MLNLAKTMDKNVLLKIGYNTFVQFGGKIISVILGFLTVVLLTRYLGVEGYGNFTLVFAYLSFFGIIADFGLQLTIVRELAQNNEKQHLMYGTYFWLKIFLVIVSTLVAIFVLFFFPYSVTLKTGILIGAIAVAIGNLNNFGTAILQSNLRLDLITLIDTITKIATVFFIVIFVFLKLNFYLIISTILLGNVIGSFTTILIVQKIVPFNNLLINLGLAKRIILLSLPIGLTTFLSLAYFKLDTIMLSLMRNSEEVGIYSLSYKFLENIFIFFGFYMATIFPLFSKYLSKNQSNEFKELFKGSIIIAIYFSIAIIIVGFLIAPNIIQILGGDKFLESILPLRILLLSTFFFFIDNIFYHAFLAIKKVKLILVITLISLLINFFLNLFFISKLGYIGASITTVITEGVMFIGYFFIARKQKFLMV